MQSVCRRHHVVHLQVKLRRRREHRARTHLLIRRVEAEKLTSIVVSCFVLLSAVVDA